MDFLFFGFNKEDSRFSLPGHARLLAKNLLDVGSIQ